MSPRSAFLDRWAIDHMPRLARIRDTAMDHIRACEDLWEHAAYLGRDTVDLSAYTADMACGTHDFITRRLSNLRLDADALGVAADVIDIDILELGRAASLWKARAENRRTA